MKRTAQRGAHFVAIDRGVIARGDEAQAHYESSASTDTQTGPATAPRTYRTGKWLTIVVPAFKLSEVVRYA